MISLCFLFAVVVKFHPLLSFATFSLHFLWNYYFIFDLFSFSFLSILCRCSRPTGCCCDRAGTAAGPAFPRKPVNMQHTDNSLNPSKSRVCVDDSTQNDDEEKKLFFLHKNSLEFKVYNWKSVLFFLDVILSPASILPHPSSWWYKYWCVSGGGENGFLVAGGEGGRGVLLSPCGVDSRLYRFTYSV